MVDITKLNEELVISSKDFKKYNQLKSSDDKTDFISGIIRGGKFTDNSLKFYTMKPNADLNVLTSSLYYDGFDTNTNKYLKFLSNNKNKVIPNINQAKLIKSSLDNNLIDVNDLSSVIYNKKAYDGSDFKLKTLMFLSNKSFAKRYGDLKTLEEFLSRILTTTSDTEIKSMLQEWGTKSGDQIKDITGLDIIKQELNGEKVSLESVSNYIGKILIENNIYSEEDWKDIFKNIKNNKKYLNYVNNLLKQSFESDFDDLSSTEILKQEVLDTLPELIDKLTNKSNKNTGLDVIKNYLGKDKLNASDLNNYIDKLVKDIKGFKDYGWSYLKDSVFSSPSWITTRNKILEKKYNKLFGDEELIDLVNEEIIENVSKILEKLSDGKA